MAARAAADGLTVAVECEVAALAVEGSADRQALLLVERRSLAKDGSRPSLLQCQGEHAVELQYGVTLRQRC